jgi:acyl-CoA reductase-like NAD-dependent aldehyde dehydrogenase
VESATAVRTAEDSIEVRNPATGTVIENVPVDSPEKVAETVRRVRGSQPEWEAIGIEGRYHWLGKLRDWLLDNRERVLETMQRETGKVRADAENEPTYLADLINFYGSHAAQFIGEESVRPHSPLLAAKKLRIQYRPHPVVGIISPWNFPLILSLGDAIPALQAGCAVVVKPSEFTPLGITEVIEAWKHEIGGPDVFDCVHGIGETGGALVDAVDFVQFTGSDATGRKVMGRAAETLTPVSLELGGKDPMIVLEDADVDLAALGAVWGAFANAGQVCASVERAYVHESVASQFLDKVVQQAQALRTGRHDEDGVDVGPLVSQRQFDIVKGLVDDAVAAGATILTGGPDPRGGSFYRPTVLVGVTPEMRIMREEIFGPVLPVLTIRGEDEAIDSANDSEFGLSASVWTRSVRRATRIAERLHVGSVWINDHMYSHNAPQLPWGGVKQSGFGRTHSKHGVYECVQVKMVGRDGGRMPRPYYFPYGSRQAKFVPTLLRAVYGRGVVGRIAGALRRLPS